MDHAVAPADLAWPACLPCPPSGLRRLRRRALVPVVRHRAGGPEGGAEAGQGGPVLVTPDPSGAAPGGAAPGSSAPGGEPPPGQAAAGAVPAWLAKLAAGTGRMVVPPRLRA